MQVQTIDTPHFGYDGRGPTLISWVYDWQCILPGTDKGRASLPGDIVGAEHSEGWVVFEQLQVFQTVPEEVHAHWFFDFLPAGARHTGVYQISDSVWKASFQPQHLADQEHFILVFYDELVEVLCRSLIFGPGTFQIHQHPELSRYGT